MVFQQCAVSDVVRCGGDGGGGDIEGSDQAG